MAELENIKKQALRMYKNKDLTINEISNLLGVSAGFLAKFFGECFRNNTLKPRNENKAMQPRVPRKFTEGQYEEIAIDYYENGLTRKELIEKWEIHPEHLQQIRNRFASKYGTKNNRTFKPVLQYDKLGRFIAKYENCMDASRATGVPVHSIRRCCLGKTKVGGGYMWVREESND